MSGPFLVNRLLFHHLAGHLHIYSRFILIMQSVNLESSKAKQAQELQAKLDQLQTESSQLLLELTTLYGKYANVLQENISLKSRVGKLEGKMNTVNVG